MDKRKSGALRIIIAIAAIIFLAYAVYILTLSFGVRRKIARLRAAGYPVTVAEFEAWRAPTPEAEQNALDLIDVLAGIEYDRHDNILYDHDVWYRLRKGDPEAIEIAGEYLSSNLEHLLAAREILKRSDFRYHSDTELVWYLRKTPWEMQLLRGGTCQYRAVSYYAQLGHFEEAFDFAEDIQRLAVTIEREPFSAYSGRMMLVNFLLNIATNTALFWDEVPEKEVERFMDILHRAEDLIDIKIHLRGAVCEYIATMYLPENRKPHLVYSGLWYIETLYYLNWIEFLTESADLPAMERRISLDEKQRNFKELPHFLMRTSAHPYGIHASILVEDIELSARLRIARTALAVDLFQRRHGRWPDDLEELIPDFFDEIPVDPFDEMPLRYRNMAEGEEIKAESYGMIFRNGVIVYSVGRDGVDNGGVFGGSINRDGSKMGLADQDLVFPLGDVDRIEE